MVVHKGRYVTYLEGCQHRFEHHPAGLVPALPSGAGIRSPEKARMNKSELSSHVAGQAPLSKAQGGEVVDAVFSAIANALARDESVVIPGFGTFSTKSREARQGRNPRTGESITIAASKSPSFKAGKTLRDAVRG